MEGRLVFRWTVWMCLDGPCGCVERRIVIWRQDTAVPDEAVAPRHRIRITDLSCFWVILHLLCV